MQRWDIESKELVGSRHREKGLLCQDSTACQVAEGKLAIALVDAVGTTDTSSKNSREMATLINQFLLEHFDMILTSDENTVSYNFMLQIEQRLSQKSKEYELDKKELASTLMGIVIDPEEGTYCMIHLGDGAIAAQEKSGKVYLLSEPENGRKLTETVLSTSEHALGHLRIHKGNLNKMKGIVLASDGIYKAHYDFEKLEEIFRSENPHDILKEKKDDQAYIKMIMSASM